MTKNIKAPHGAQLSCKGWGQEAALRMLMNNLDPEVAEKPDDLVVYGGTGKARAIGRRLTRLCAVCSRWKTTKPCWCNRASRSAFFARTKTRRAC